MPPAAGLSQHLALTHAKTLAAIQTAQAGALLVTSPANVQYLTGYRSFPHGLRNTNQTSVLLTRDGELTLLLPSSDGDYVSMGGFEADHVVTFGTFYIEAAAEGAALTPDEEHMRGFAAQMTNRDSWADLVLHTLTHAGLADKRLLVDEGYLLPGYAAQLRQAVPDAAIENARDFMLRMRAVKTPYEIELLRAASRCVEIGIRAGLERAHAGGATDVDIRDAYEKALIDQGAEHLFSAIGVGGRTCFPNVQPNGTPLSDGGLLRFDVGGRYHGYTADLARNAVLGEPAPNVRSYYRALLAGEEAAFEILRPGVLASEVFERAVTATRQAGLPHYRRHHCGHSIGLESYEAPLIRPEDRVPLEAGMTFCIETPYYELGLGGLQVEDMVVITADGFERLTSLSRDLFELVR
jgi:Xaa-Pro aminopeptidase